MSLMTGPWKPQVVSRTQLSCATFAPKIIMWDWHLGNCVSTKLNLAWNRPLSSGDPQITSRPFRETPPSLVRGSIRSGVPEVCHAMEWEPPHLDATTCRHKQG